ncbi:cytochrome c oxidase accessory protein CcoG [Leeia oryzae]|uniref:cytochrome c oxidase accessory protein CcoG n=1 Tax=Leeia oryzae TaxID=356662 RepID=UPI00037A0F12|nr:cytochrome c oxidase accessory protein CcoG [Leeia oryzae]
MQASPIQFYPKNSKIYPKAIQGRFNDWRWWLVWATQIIFFGGCWLQWDHRQAILFDISQGRFYLFGLVLWPQDALILAFVMIMAAVGLFWVTAIAGRLFCGFACPQTVYTSVFMWLEARIEGDHLARKKLADAPASPRKVLLKTTKHLVWALFALWAGLTFLGYFTPMAQLPVRITQLALGPWETFWWLFYAAFMYVQAGLAREAVCQHMCPYSRFQGVMFDAHTRTVTYDAARGEPRGARKHGEAAHVAAKGDCVDCGICVQVCPTGIDIRNGLQYQCINCGLCADACDQVMEKIQAPTGLIRFASEQELALVTSPAKAVSVHRPRVWVYGGIMTVVLAASAVFMWQRQTVQMDVLRDRGALVRENVDGNLENAYTLRISNMVEAPRTYRLRVQGTAGMRLLGQPVIQAGAGEVVNATVTVVAPADTPHKGALPIEFVIQDTAEAGRHNRALTTFIYPM